MAQATQTEADLMEQAQQLQQEAAQDEQEYRELMAQAQQKWAERNEKLGQVADLFKQAAEQEPEMEPVNGATRAPAPARKPAPQPARPAAKRPAPAPQPARKPVPARPAATAPAKKGAAAPAARKAKVEPHERNYGQDTSLRKEIWAVLDREPASYKQYLPDYPDGAAGLKVSEIKEIIEKEGKWKSTSENISPQIQGHLYKLKEEGKIHRNEEDRRYYIVAGAVLDPAPAEAK